MFNFIPLPKITVTSLFAILLAGLAWAEPSTAKKEKSQPSPTVESSRKKPTKKAGTCERVNNGHGNNQPLEVTLSDGTSISGTYDPSNPGRSGEKKLEIRDSQGVEMSYEDLMEALEENDDLQAEYNHLVQDIELKSFKSAFKECYGEYYVTEGSLPELSELAIATILEEPYTVYQDSSSGTYLVVTPAQLGNTLTLSLEFFQESGMSTNSLDASEAVGVDFPLLRLSGWSEAATITAQDEGGNNVALYTEADTITTPSDGERGSGYHDLGNGTASYGTIDWTGSRLVNSGQNLFIYGNQNSGGFQLSFTLAGGLAHNQNLFNLLLVGNAGNYGQNAIIPSGD